MWTVFAIVVLIVVLLCMALAGSFSSTSPVAANQHSRLADYDDDKTSANKPLYIPYSNGSNFEHGLYVRASVNGGPVRRFRVDTGSVGMVVGATDVGTKSPSENVGLAVPGQITYTSSGVQLDGEWRDSIVTFVDAFDSNGAPLQARVPVLAVEQRRVLPGRVNPAQESSGPPHVAMLGIGFGRNRPASTRTKQQRNPLLSLVGASNAGYILDRNGIDLSMKSEDEFVTQKLIPVNRGNVNSGGDWQTPVGTIQIGSKGKVQNTSILIDTGLTNMMIGVPNLPRMEPVENGTFIKVGLLGGRVPYSFIVGDRNDPSAPSKVTLIRPRSNTRTLNTGLHALAHYDYLFDAQKGQVGLKRIL
jgi:hypothetical protein